MSDEKTPALIVDYNGFFAAKHLPFCSKTDLENPGTDALCEVFVNIRESPALH